MLRWIWESASKGSTKDDAINTSIQAPAEEQPSKPSPLSRTPRTTPPGREPTPKPSAYVGNDTYFDRVENAVPAKRTINQLQIMQELPVKKPRLREVLSYRAPTCSTKADSVAHEPIITSTKRLRSFLLTEEPTLRKRPRISNNDDAINDQVVRSETHDNSEQDAQASSHKSSTSPAQDRGRIQHSLNQSIGGLGSSSPSPTLSESNNTENQENLSDRHQSPTLLAWSQSGNAIEAGPSSRLAKVSISELSWPLSFKHSHDETGQFSNDDKIHLPPQKPKRVTQNSLTTLPRPKANDRMPTTASSPVQQYEVATMASSIPKRPSLTPKKRIVAGKKQRRLPGTLI